MAAFIDEGMHFRNINTFFVCLYWECCVTCRHAQSLLQELKDIAHVLMVRVFHVSQFWWCKFRCAIGVRMFSLITVCLEKILPHQFPGCYWNILLSIHLRISDFWTWVGSHQFPAYYFDFFSFTEHPRIDKRYQTLWRHGLAFAIGEPSFEVVFFPFLTTPCFLISSSEINSLKCLQEYIEKLMVLNKQRRWFHSSLEKLPLVRMSSSCFGVFWCQLSRFVSWGPYGYSVKQPIKSNSVGSGHVSHRWSSSFNHHFDHGFVVFKDEQQKLSLRRMCVCGYIIHVTHMINLLSSCDMLCLGLGIKNCTNFLVAWMFGVGLVVGWM